jgi:DNA-binding transcriptional regulator YiaG
MVRMPPIPEVPASVPQPATDADWLRGFKRRTGLSSADLAKILGIGSRRVTGWSAGQEPMPHWGRAALYAYNLGRAGGWRPPEDGKCRLTREDLLTWKSRHGLSNRTAAELLGVSARTVAEWLSAQPGAVERPIWLEAACRGVDAGWKPEPGKAGELAA